MSDNEPANPPESSTDIDMEIKDASTEDVSRIIPDHTASKEKPPLFALGGKSKTKTKPKKDKKPTPRPRKGSLVEPLASIYTTIGALLTPIDPYCGNALIVHAENCAKTLDDLAQHNESVRRALIALTQTSTWGAVAAAHAPIIMAIAVHHIPAMQEKAGSFGEEMAKQMDAQFKAETNGNKG